MVNDPRSFWLHCLCHRQADLQSQINWNLMIPSCTEEETKQLVAERDKINKLQKKLIRQGVAEAAAALHYRPISQGAHRGYGNQRT
jgi:hypothetical protein